eukprot:40801-Eustigmatos_ZCMA.PRE.1
MTKHQYMNIALAGPLERGGQPHHSQHTSLQSQHSYTHTTDCARSTHAVPFPHNHPYIPLVVRLHQDGCA